MSTRKRHTPVQIPTIELTNVISSEGEPIDPSNIQNTLKKRNKSKK